MPKRKPDRSTQRAPQNSPNAELALSPLHERLEHLQASHRWFVKQIKRKRTELDNFINQMRLLATEMFRQVMPVYEQYDAVDREIHDLFAEILSRRKLGKKSRRQIEQIYEGLQATGSISFSPEGDEGNDDDAREAEPFNFSEGFPSQDPAEPEASSGTRSSESGNMRQTFLRLASVFHPDRAAAGDEREQNAEIMKEINRAYKAGDFARLLELERQHDLGETEFAASDDRSDLERQCDRLERTNEALSEQYEGIKAELRSLRNDTQEGELVRAYRQAEREGVDFFAELLAAAAADLQDLEALRDFVRDFRDRKITLAKFLKGPSGAIQVSSKDLIVVGIPPELAEAGIPPELLQALLELQDLTDL